MPIGRRGARATLRTPTPACAQARDVVPEPPIHRRGEAAPECARSAWPPRSARPRPPSALRNHDVAAEGPDVERRAAVAERRAHRVIVAAATARPTIVARAARRVA